MAEATYRTKTESSGFHLHDAGVIEPSENREGWSMQKKKVTVSVQQSFGRGYSGVKRAIFSSLAQKQVDLLRHTEHLQ